MKLHDAINDLGGDRDRAGAVAQSVLDKVAKRLFEPDAIARELEVVRRVNDQGAALGLATQRESPAHAVEQLARGERIGTERQLALIGARHQQQAAVGTKANTAARAPRDLLQRDTGPPFDGRVLHKLHKVD